MITSTISQRGQTTLPKQVRDALGLESGKRLIYDIKEDRVIIRAHPGVSSSFGVFRDYAVDQDWKEIRSGSREGWAEHVSEEGLDT